MKKVRGKMSGKSLRKAVPDSGLFFQMTAGKMKHRSIRNTADLLDRLDWNQTVVFTQAEIGKEYHLNETGIENVFTALDLYLDAVCSDRDAPARVLIGNVSNDFGVLCLLRILRFKRNHPGLVVLSMKGGGEHPRILPGVSGSLGPVNGRCESVLNVIVSMDYALDSGVPNLLKIVLTKSRRIVTDEMVWKFKSGPHMIPPEIVNYYRAFRKPAGNP